MKSYHISFLDKAKNKTTLSVFAKNLSDAVKSKPKHTRLIAVSCEAKEKMPSIDSNAKMLEPFTLKFKDGLTEKKMFCYAESNNVAEDFLFDSEESFTKPTHIIASHQN